MRKTRRFSIGGALLITAFLAAVTAFPLFAQPNGEPPAGQEAAATGPQVYQNLTEAQRAAIEYDNKTFVKTYELKYIRASEFMRSAKFYVLDSTGTENSLTVRIQGRQIAAFEALMKKLDVEKKSIQFRVYAITACKELPTGEAASASKSYLQMETKEITDKNLKKVLDEMKGLWNFEHFWINSPSFLVVKDGSGLNRSKLVANSSLELYMRDITLRGDEPNKRMISVGEISLAQSWGDKTESLINTSDITFKENGYLVVGVSGMNIGITGMAVILIINAEIR
ncbi:MAG: hypothetical protein PHI34_08355 [Acidobacteriota bacterium]|nr:hypothetical protein [Acidobacteriota bacterium]